MSEKGRPGSSVPPGRASGAPPGRGPSSGASLVEVLAVLAMFGTALGMAALYLRAVESPLAAGQSRVEGGLRQARASAIATTSAYRVRPDGDGGVVGETAVNCAAGTWTVDPRLRHSLPRDVTLTDPTWEVCFGADGLSSDNVTIGLWHPDLGTRRVEVLRGGATRELP